MVITGRVARWIAVLAVLAVFLFDGFSIVAAHLSANDDAQAAAQAGASAFHQLGTVNGTLLAIQQDLPRSDTLVAGSLVVTANGEVSLRVQRTARSLALHLLSATRKWAVVTESGDADAPS